MITAVLNYMPVSCAGSSWTELKSVELTTRDSIVEEYGMTVSFLLRVFITQRPRHLWCFSLHARDAASHYAPAYYCANTMEFGGVSQWALLIRSLMVLYLCRPSIIPWDRFAHKAWAGQVPVDSTRKDFLLPYLILHIYYITILINCQILLLRRRWDLNPR